ncbi:hypothetical protein BBRE_1128 [Bifidobacterium breve]|nr:hypothetical protein [Bifidobacterium breve]KFI49830.1 hypothetical protein BBRE_1128 [Bifidobacterium breve]
MITACRNKYDAITLYEDIANMDRTERRSSIIAVKDANRYLLYRDFRLGDATFFPNHATASSTDEDVRQLTTYFADEFGIPAKDFTLSHICVKDSEKPSAEHDGEVRYYEYTLYRASVTVMPDAWRSTEFHVGAKDCRWMTLDEMLADLSSTKSIMMLLRWCGITCDCCRLWGHMVVGPKRVLYLDNHRNQGVACSMELSIP